MPEAGGPKALLRKDTSMVTHSHQGGGMEAPVFSTLVHSIASSALMAMGQVPEMKNKKDKAMAGFHVDLLILLKEKTKNNLNTEEQMLIDQCIQDLQISFSRAFA